MNELLISVQPVLRSSDLGRSCDFYEKLGFEITFRDDQTAPKYVGVVRDGVELHLQWHTWEHFEQPTDCPTYRFVVRDIDALYNEFKSSGVISEEATGQSPWKAPGKTPWGTYEFHLQDPDRNGLQFYQILGL